MVCNKLLSHRVATEEQWLTKAREIGIDRWSKELLVGVRAKDFNPAMCLFLLVNSPSHNAALLFEFGKTFGVAYKVVDDYAFVTLYVSNCTIST